MTRIRRLGIAACATAALVTSACGSDDTADGGTANGGTADAAQYGDCEVTGEFNSHPLTPAVAGALTVETSLPSPGWWNGDTPEGMSSGYEYCMAANIAHRGGLKTLDVKAVSFDSIVSGQTQGFDLALVTISITPDRQKVVQFSPPYFNGDIGVLVKKGTEATADSLRSMTVGVQLGTVGQSFAEEKLGLPASALKVFPDTGSMTTALAAGQVDAVLNDTAQCLNVAKQSGSLLEVVGQFETGESYGAVYPADTANKEALDAIITELKSDGTLDGLAADYLAPAFGGDPTKVPYLEVS